MRIVVKVGTSTLAHPGGLLNIRHTEDLVRVWSDIQNAGHQLIVVSSAATGLGAGKLQIEKPGDLVTKQAAAAVGQCELMYTYDRLFGQYNHTVAQMLLTWRILTTKTVCTTCKTRWSVFCSCTPSPSSTRMTPSPARNTLWATTTRWPRWWPSASTPIWSC